MKNIFAKLISILFGLPLLVLISFYGVFLSSFDIKKSLFVIAILSIFQIIIPVLTILYLLWTKRIGDIEIEKRGERILPFSIITLCFFVATVIAYTLGEQILFHYQLILFIILLVNFVITLFWKISLHMAASTVMGVFIVTFSGWKFVPLFIILPLVYWARLFLKRHTHGQLIAGFVVNIGVTLALLYYFGYFTSSISKPFSTTNTNKIVISDLKKSENNLFTIKVVAENLEIPWTLLFTSDRRLLVTERGGRVRQIVDGDLKDAPVHVFGEVAHVGEAGLLGLTKDPDYSLNKLLYFCMSYKKNGKMTNKVAVAKDMGEKLADIKTLIDNLPSAQYHAGCRVAFGPDEKLYVTTGDVTEKGLAQDTKSLAGKILRYNSDGSVPVDNPYPNSPIYSLGHRNVQGIAWDKTGVLYATEHGPSGFDGPGGGDEINIIEKGGNYGWPIVHHQESDSRFIDPLFVMTPAEAPSGAMFYSGKLFAQWSGQLFFTALKGEGLMRALTDGSNINLVEKMYHGEFGRIRDVIEGEDGVIYFTTSNRDGRGKVNEGDDKVIAIITK